MKIEIANQSHLAEINIIRKAISQDITNGHKLADIDFYEFENNNKRVSFVNLVAQKTVGYITVHNFEMFDQDDSIFEMFVLPEYQGRGFGSALIKHTEKHIKANMPFKRLLLGVLHSNERAFALYKRLDFEVLKSEPKGMYMSKVI